MKFIDRIKQLKIKRKEKKQKVLQLELPKIEPPPLPVINKEELKENIDPISEENTEPRGLKSHLQEVNEKLNILTKRDKKTEQKEFKLPSKIKRQLKKMALKDKIMVLYLTNNRVMKPVITEIKNGSIIIEGKPHQCTPDFVFLWKGKYPAIVLPEWNMTPIGTKDYYTAVAEKRVADPIAVGIRMMEDKDNLMKKKLSLSPMMWVLIGLALVAGAYVLFGGG